MNSHDTIRSIDDWFKLAVPTPGTKNIHTQLGVHFEEVVEMLAELRGNDRLTQSMLTAAMVSLHGLALHLKAAKGPLVKVESEARMLDALGDQVVTATGVAHMLSYLFPEALREIDRSNWSKFVDGKPIFDENQKITKGPNYTPPDIARFAF